MRLLPCVLILITLTLGPAAGAAERITVFGAASLTEALEEIGARFHEKTGIGVRFSFASSSVLARQIEAGAPADVVALASSDWADYLDQRGLTVPGTRIAPIGNRLAVVAPADSPATLSDPPSGDELAAALGPEGRVAIGDPAHVPAGIYAKQSLESLGLWQDLAPRLAYASDVRGALALVERGEAPLGIVYATDARAAPGARVLALLPGNSHARIAYAFAAVSGGNAAMASDFLNYLSGPEALAVFARGGFTVQ